MPSFSHLPPFAFRLIYIFLSISLSLFSFSVAVPVSVSVSLSLFPLALSSLSLLYLLPFFSLSLSLNLSPLSLLSSCSSPLFSLLSPLAFLLPSCCLSFRLSCDHTAIMSLNELRPQPSLVDLPRELIALMAPHLQLADVCQVRATCRTLASCSAALAGACRPARCALVRDGVFAPEAVLAWAVCGDLIMRRCEARPASQKEARKAGEQAQQLLAKCGAYGIAAMCMLS